MKKLGKTTFPLQESDLNENYLSLYSFFCYDLTLNNLYSERKFIPASKKKSLLWKRFAWTFIQVWDGHLFSLFVTYVLFSCNLQTNCWYCLYFIHRFINGIKKIQLIPYFKKLLNYKTKSNSSNQVAFISLKNIQTFSSNCHQ